MKVVFTKYKEDMNHEVQEFEVNEIRYSGGWVIGLDIVDVGWRTITSDQYSSFVVTNS